VPREQCPACGRFLKRGLIDGLADGPAPCPRCGIELRAELFPVAAAPVAEGRAAHLVADDPVADGPVADEPVGPPPAPAAALAGVPVATTATLEVPSVRPPDLPPADVRGVPDPLAGWDAGVPSGPAVVRDERPFPTDTVAVAAATVAGAALGAVLGRRPVRDAFLAALGGAVGAGVARRIWQLP
jgi:hypothetical protein